MAKMQAFNSGFGIDQLIAASEAARNFSGLRKSAKLAPRLILENNKPDSVILSKVICHRFFFGICTEQRFCSCFSF